MSNESTAQSQASNRRRSVATLIVMVMLCIYWGALFFGTHTPLPPGILPGNSDKLIHFGAFLGLGVLLMTLRATRGPFRWRNVIVRWLVLAGYGIFDEVTQALVGRDAEFFDWVADSIGAAAGLCLVTLLYRIFQVKRKVPVVSE